MFSGCDGIMAVQIKSKTGQDLKVKVNFRTVWALFGKGMLALDGRSKTSTKFIMSAIGRDAIKTLEIPKDEFTMRPLPDFDY